MDPLRKHPFISWFAANPVVANILMFSILAAGIFTAFNVRKEGFPSFDAKSVTVRVPIRGGTPEDVERGIAIQIEESLQTVDGIHHISSVSTESSATVTVEAKENYPIRKLLDDVKVQVDAIQRFPEQAEKPVITENQRQREVLWIELYGDVSEEIRKEEARALRDELLRQPAISQVAIFGARDYEISIEPSEDKLRQYDLTFAEVSEAVSNNSLDLGGGVVRSDRGDIALRSKDQAYNKRDFEEIPLRTNADGTRILLRDVAQVRDGFVDQQTLNRFRGLPTTSLKVTTVGNEDLIEATNQGKEVVKNYTNLPDGLNIASWQDGSTNIRDRLTLLGTNGLIGVLLVLGILMIFLNLRLAFWVAVGIPVSLAGAVTLFPIPGLDMSVNLVSAFGFLVVLGIVVDDAIVIGESIFSEKQNAELTTDLDSHLRTTVVGVSKVIVPATFGVVTTIAAFLPLTQVSGNMGNVFGQIATTVVFCLAFSLLESKIILPAHLAHINVHRKPRNAVTRSWARFQKWVNNSLNRFIERVYLPIIRLLISWRYATLAGFVAIFIIVLGLFPAGKIRFVFFPSVYSDSAAVNLQLEQGQSVEYLHQTAERIAAATEKLGKEYQDEFGHNPFLEVQISASSNDRANVAAELTRSTEREFLPASKIVGDWRKEIGTVAGARSLSFRATAGPTGGDFQVNLESEDLDELRIAAAEMKEILDTFTGVFDVTDSFNSGRPEIRYSITPEGQAADLTKRDLAVGVRDAFFGREAQRVQRGREEVRVMVRYPYEERGSLETLRNMRLRKPDGSTIPFSVVADTEYTASLASIERFDNKRVVTVSASIDKGTTSPGDVNTQLAKEFFPTMKSRHPGITIGESGQVEERNRSLQSLITGFIFSIVFIYVLIAIPLRSYIQPLIIMTVIPFGVIGAILGHYAMGIPVSILSLFGVLALSGVVVNDSLVLVCHINDLRKDHEHTLAQACRIAGANRFRAILLTSLTTFFGLAPLLLEKEVQAQFLKPMAASLAFGILFATIITLFLLPVLLIIFRDIRNLIRVYLGRERLEN